MIAEEHSIYRELSEIRSSKRTESQKKRLAAAARTLRSYESAPENMSPVLKELIELGYI